MNFINNKVVLEINTKNSFILEKTLKYHPKEIWSFQEENEVTEYLREKYPMFDNNFVTTSLDKRIQLLKENFDIIIIENKLAKERVNKILEVISFYLKEEGLLLTKTKISTNLFRYIKKEQEYYQYKKR